ncbi:MAG TPA: NUDIX hydrolase [Candidatus Dormibacteraeota bacterium]|nr:NUDIX hydrolase [Candidatus Dormibacteraeota bacterium]
MGIRIRVACAAVDELDRVLLVQHRKEGREYWLLPGGGVEVGETMLDAARRELFEETGLEGDIGAVVLVCESIEGRTGRHIVHVTFAATVRSGTLHPGYDGRLVDADWLPVQRLADLTLFPAIGSDLLACHAEGFAGPVRYLGNVWRDMPGLDVE